MTHDHNEEHICDSCSGKSDEELATKLMNDIIQFGHQVRFVFPEEGSDAPRFWYTIGRSVEDKPELYLTGPLPASVGQTILNDAARLHDEGKISLTHGELIPADVLLSGYSVKVIEIADLEAAEMYGVTSYFNDPTAVQIVWPDASGCFPGDAGYDYPTRAQPLFG